MKLKKITGFITAIAVSTTAFCSAVIPVSAAEITPDEAAPATVAGYEASLYDEVYGFTVPDDAIYENKFYIDTALADGVKYNLSVGVEVVSGSTSDGKNGIYYFLRNSAGATLTGYSGSQRQNQVTKTGDSEYKTYLITSDNLDYATQKLMIQVNNRDFSQNAKTAFGYKIEPSAFKVTFSEGYEPVFGVDSTGYANAGTEVGYKKKSDSKIYKTAISSVTTIGDDTTGEEVTSDVAVEYDGKMEFCTFDEAMTKIIALEKNSRTGIINLLRDVSIERYTIGYADSGCVEELTINGNGHTLTGTNSNYMFEIGPSGTRGGNFTLNNITLSGGFNTATVSIKGNQNINVTFINAKIENSKDSPIPAFYVQNSKAFTFKIDGATTIDGVGIRGVGADHVSNFSIKPYDGTDIVLLEQLGSWSMYNSSHTEMTGYTAYNDWDGVVRLADTSSTAFENTPQLAIDYANRKLTSYTDGASYTIKTTVSTDETAAIALGSSTDSISDEWFGKSIYIQKAATDTNKASSIQSLAIPSLPKTPIEGTDFTVTQPVAGTDTTASIKLLGDANGMEYSLNNGESWADVPATDIPQGSNVTVRKKAVADTSFASEATAEIVIDKYYTIAVAEDIQNGVITTSPSGNTKQGEAVTITATPSESYKLKGNSVKVVKTDDTSVEVTVNDNTFIMPNYNVTVTAEFEKADSEVTPTPEVTPIPEVTPTPDATPLPTPTIAPDNAILSISLDGEEAVEYTDYSTAIAVISGNDAVGKTAQMNILQDFETGNVRAFINNGNISKLTINGNGHTMTGGSATVMFEGANNGELIINNLTISGHRGNDGAVSAKGNSKITLNGVTMTGNKTGVYLQSATATVSADNATSIDVFRIRDTAMSGILAKSAPIIVNKVTGGEDLSVDMITTLSNEGYELYLTDGSIAMQARKVTEPQEDSVVSVTIGDETTYYTSYNAAMTYANTLGIGNAVELNILKDDTTVGSVRSFMDSGNILKLIINGNGNTLSGASQSVLFEVGTGGAIELKNITISGNSCRDGSLSVKGTGRVTLENVILDKLYLQSADVVVTADENTVINEYCIRDTVEVYEQLTLLTKKSSRLSASQIVALTTQESEGKNNMILKGYEVEAGTDTLYLHEKQPVTIAKIIAEGTENGDYEVKSDLELDDEGDITIKVKNNADTSADVTLYAVSYNENGELETVTLITQTVRSGFTKALTMENPENAQYYLLWADGVRPIVYKMDVKNKIEVAK